MARKPRELWAASYLFSELMKRIAETIPDDVILSPAKLDKENAIIGIGLYPDRIYFEGNYETYKGTIQETVSGFAEEIGINGKYLKVYAVETTLEKEVIKNLNKLLDNLELHNIAASHDDDEKIIELLLNNPKYPVSLKYNKNPLWEIALGNGKEFKIEGKEYETLAEIATAQLEKFNKVEYNYILNNSKEEEHQTGNDVLIKNLQNADFVKNDKLFRTPHKYICIVTADGDNVGKIAGGCNETEIKNLSKRLLDFGKKAVDSIKKYDGFPIYAGGDDLLFIAPTISGTAENPKTIFDLINDINANFEDTVKKDTNYSYTPSMSYGIAITYYKFPLYEALKMSREQLEQVAKKQPKKNAIAWELQKHSGFAVKAAFSNNSDIKGKFNALVTSMICNDDDKKKKDEKETGLKNLVSAVAHKIRANETLLALCLKDTGLDRLTPFFLNFLDYDNKKSNEKEYLDAVKLLLSANYADNNKDMEKTIEITYAMLRTAKFINGLEDDKDE